MKCQCSTCKCFSRWREVLQIDTPEKEEVFGQMLERIESAETDLIWHKEVINGNWVNADKVLEIWGLRRERILQKNNNEPT